MNKKFKITDEQNIEREANLITIFENDGKEYAVYSIDRDAEEWYLYDFEYAALKDVLFDMCNLFNAEMTMSAQALGVGKESEGIATYWKSKLEADEKAFTDKSLVTYIA